MDINVTITPSIASVGKAMDNINVTSFLRGEINRFAALVERYGKQFTPVKTGRLRASFHFSPAGSFLRAVVSTNTNYDVFVHEGTRYMRARPFLKEGVDIAQKSYGDADVSRRLESEIVKAFKTL